MGEEALAESSPLSGASVPRSGGVMVVVVELNNDLIEINVEPGGPRRVLFAWVLSTCRQLI